LRSIVYQAQGAAKAMFEKVHLSIDRAVQLSDVHRQ
jgi:hypothetical protein